MKKEVKLFDKRFVHFMWGDELEGKEGFFANTIADLQNYLELNSAAFFGKYKKSKFAASFPFELNHNAFIFFYYDPNYETKKAFNEGKAIQFKDDVSGEWCSAYNPRWDLNIKYRIKPKEDERWVVCLRRSENDEGIYLTSCREDDWKEAKETYNAKTKLFVGTESETIEWQKSRQKFVKEIKAWEDGKEIQIRHTPNSDWVDLNNETPQWHDCYEYRVKLDCPCEDEINSKACAGCPQDEARKDQSEMERETYYVTKYADGFRVTPFKALGARFSGTKLECEDYVKYQEMKNEGAFTQKKITYRPYESSAEMIADFIARFKVKCPSYAEPLIWLGHKQCPDHHYLITGFALGAGIRMGGSLYNFEDLLNDYKYLDGSPVGKEC